MIRASMIVGAMALLSTSAMGQQVFFDNFDGALSPDLSGITNATSVQGFNGLGAAGNQFSGSLIYNDSFGNPAQATTLTLTNLPAHTQITIGFLLAVIDSWDSDDGSPSPDLFNVHLDGVQVFQATFANQSGSTNYAPPAGGDIGGLAQRGFSNFNDRAYDLSLESALQNIPHTASTATITFFASGAGWQGSSDESFGIDNLRVSVAIPTPGATGLLALAGVLASRRRRA